MRACESGYHEIDQVTGRTGVVIPFHLVSDSSTPNPLSFLKRVHPLRIWRVHALVLCQFKPKAPRVIHQ